MVNQEKKEEPKEETPKEEKRLLDKPVQIKDLILMTLYSLEGKAWAYLGLVAHPETGKPQKDITEAKLAIDAVESLYKLIEQSLEQDERRDIQTRLTNLRLNFVKG